MKCVNIQKIMCICVILSQSLQVLENCQTLIFTWKLKFDKWQQMLLVVFLEITVSFHLFSRKCLQNIQT